MPLQNYTNAQNAKADQSIKGPLFVQPSPKFQLFCQLSESTELFLKLKPGPGLVHGQLRF